MSKKTYFEATLLTEDIKNHYDKFSIFLTPQPRAESSPALSDNDLLNIEEEWKLGTESSPKMNDIVNVKIVRVVNGKEEIIKIPHSISINTYYEYLQYLVCYQRIDFYNCLTCLFIFYIYYSISFSN